MAGPKRIITLSIGSQTISMAEFSREKRGMLKLKHVETRDLIPDPAADASRSSQGALHISEMTAALKAKSQTVKCTLPAQATFSRLVKIPSFSQDEFSKTVAFEAQQNIPYPLAEVTWDYKTVADASSQEPEVLIVAAKNDLLDEWTAGIAESKLKLSTIDLSPLAIYNAFRYNYGEPEGCSLLIDLGARTTNLLFIETGKFFVRTISSGGNALTAAVAKEFGEPMMAAEERKCSSGSIGRGSNFAEDEDPDVAKLAKVLRNAVTRLHAEIARSISFYRSQQGGSAPSKIYLSGGGANMPLMKEFWEEKLNLEVERFNPFRCVLANNDKIPTLAKLAPVLGEHVGLALEYVSQCPVSVNLLPQSIRSKARLAQICVAIGLAAASVCAPILVWGISLRRSAEVASNLKEELTPRLEKLERTDRQIKATQADIKSSLDSVIPLQTAIAERDYWVRLIDHIHSCLPKKYVWVTNLQIPQKDPIKAAPTNNPFGFTAEDPNTVAQADKDKKNAGKTDPSKPSQQASPPPTRLVIKGLYLENPESVAVVDAFGKSLSAENPFFTTTAPDQWVRTNKPNPVDWAQDFSIPVELKTPPQKTLKVAP
jgi:type IV pilus assembly protein PilM